MYICIHTPRHMKDDARKQQKLIYRLEKGDRSTRKGSNTENKSRECWLIWNTCKGTWANSLWRSLASSFPLKAQEVIMVPVSFCNISRLRNANCYTVIIAKDRKKIKRNDRIYACIQRRKPVAWIAHPSMLISISVDAQLGEHTTM